MTRSAREPRDARKAMDESRVASEAVVCSRAMAGWPIDTVVVEDIRLLSICGDLSRTARAPDLVEVPSRQGISRRAVESVAVSMDVDLSSGRGWTGSVEISGCV